MKSEGRPALRFAEEKPPADYVRRPDRSSSIISALKSIEARTMIQFYIFLALDFQKISVYINHTSWRQELMGLWF